MKIILAIVVACIPSVLGQLAAADEAEFLRLSTLRVSRLARQCVPFWPKSRPPQHATPSADFLAILLYYDRQAASRDRPDSSSPKIRTARNGIEISTPPDGEVTLRVGTNASISLNAIPSAMRGCEYNLAGA